MGRRGRKRCCLQPNTKQAECLRVTTDKQGLPLQAGVRRLGLCLPPTPIGGVEAEHSSLLSHLCLTRIARVLAIPQAASTFFRVCLLSIITALPKEQRGSTPALDISTSHPVGLQHLTSVGEGMVGSRRSLVPTPSCHKVKAECTSGVLYLRERDSPLQQFELQWCHEGSDSYQIRIRMKDKTAQCQST